MKSNLAFIGLLNVLLFVNGQNGFKSHVQFAAVEKATALLNTNDAYTNHLSKFDLNARLHKQNGTKEEQFKNITAQIGEWTPEEIQKINAALDADDKYISAAALKIPFPKEIFLVKSTMKDEGGSDGYTRGTCIVLKDDVIQLPEAKLQEILLHELFHILSRTDSIFRQKMYTIIGFHLMNEVDYPADIKDFRITNPDAARSDSYISLEKNGKTADYIMMLYSGKEYTTGEFFEYINIGFVQLKGDTIKEPVLINGKPVIYSPDALAEAFIQKIGLNTEYIIDPEEIMADNFVMAVTNKKGLPSPWITVQIRENLKK